MKIAFDIDGVIANGDALRQAVCDHFGLDDSCRYSYNFNLPKEEIESFIDEYGADIFSNSNLEVDILEVINLLIGMGHEIFYITARNPKYKEITYNWFLQHKIPFDEEHMIFNGDKAGVCREYKINVMIEDSAENANALASSNVLVFLLQRPYNQLISTDSNWVVRVRNARELILMIQAAQIVIGSGDKS